MILESVEVAGLRSLHDVRPVAIGRPTVLTGRNDAGKTTFLTAVKFLLGATKLDRGDLSELGPETHSEEVAVTGVFSLRTVEQELTNLPGTVRVRRVFSPDSAPRLLVETSVPVDPRLRAIDQLGLRAMRELVDELGTPVTGHLGRKSTYLAALEPLAAAADRMDVWIAASSALESLLPVFVHFSSTDEVDPEIEVKNALRVAYESLLREEAFARRIGELERDANTRLGQSADELRAHLVARTGLNDLQVDPRISLRPSFPEVVMSAVKASGEPAHALRAGGAGRRRQVALAVWEWTSDLLRASDAEGQDIVIAYDEPDTHLDYPRQRELMSLLKSQCEIPGVRMIVITHSLVFIDRLPVQNITLFALERGASVVQTIDSEGDEAVDRFLSDLSSQMGVRNSTLIHERVLVLVEGDTEARVLPRLFQLVTGLLPQELGLAVIAANNNDGALRLGSVLSSRGRAVRVVIDSDTKTSPTAKKYLRPERLAELGFREGENVLYVGDRELEDAFGDVAWVVAASRLWPRVDGALWDAAQFSQYRQDKFSTRVLEMLRVSSEDGPASKQEMVEGLVHTLDSTEHIHPGFVATVEALAGLAAAS